MSDVATPEEAEQPATDTLTAEGRRQQQEALRRAKSPPVPQTFEEKIAAVRELHKKEHLSIAEIADRVKVAPKFVRTVLEERVPVEDIDTDPPGVRSERFAEDSDLRLNEQVRVLRAERSRLGSHSHRTAAHVHTMADDLLDLPKQRIEAKVRSLARALVGSTADNPPSLSNELALAFYLDPKLAKRLHAEVDKLEVAPADREPSGRELSHHDADELKAEIGRLTEQIDAYNEEIDMRPRRRQRVAAERAEAEHEARWASTERR